jgi:hypothetical protein
MKKVNILIFNLDSKINHKKIINLLNKKGAEDSLKKDEKIAEDLY